MESVVVAAELASVDVAAADEVGAAVKTEDEAAAVPLGGGARPRTK